MIFIRFLASTRLFGFALIKLNISARSASPIRCALLSIRSPRESKRRHAQRQTLVCEKRKSLGFTSLRDCDQVGLYFCGGRSIGHDSTRYIDDGEAIVCGYRYPSVLCRGGTCIHRRIQQQIFLGNNDMHNCGRIPLVLRHKRVALSKSQAMTRETAASRCFMNTQASNQSVELTATRRTRTFQMIKTSSLRAPLALVGGSSLLSR